MHRTFLHSTALVSVALLALSTSPAIAQEVAADAASADTGKLGEIVVTAERRTSTVQKTPIAIAVYTGSQLAEQGISDLRGLAKIAPNVNIATAAGQSIITIRGISSRDTTEVGDPAVAVDIDGFYNNRPFGLNTAMFDLDRVEVLRGPQGTLNGRNAVGGAINIITAKPVDKFEADGSIAYGNYNALETRGMINVPISDKVQVRAAFMTASHDGYRNNAPSPNGDDNDTKAARLSIAFQPTERFSGLIALEYSNIGGAGQALYNTPLLYNADGTVDHSRPVLPADDKTWPLGIDLRQHMDQKAIRWQFNYLLLPNVKLTYLGGYSDLSWMSTADLSRPDSPHVFVQNEHPHTQNHEFRVSSVDEGRLTWQAGVFYFKESSSIYDWNLFPNATNGTYHGFTFRYPTVDAQSVSGYGQASFALTDTLKVTGGVRYNDDKKTRLGGFYIPLTTVEPITFLMVAQSGHGHWTKFTYHGGLDWQVTPRNLLYAKVDTGYKAGGFDDVGAYQPETVTAYEAGAKNRFADGKLELNISGFYDDYKNQQVSQLIVVGNNAGATQIQNAGSSHIYGAEVDSAANIAGIGRIGLSIDYLHAKFVDFIGSLPDGSGNANFAGNDLPQSPKITIGANFEHKFTMDIGVVTFQATTKFTTKQHYSFYNYADDLQKSYTNTDLSLGFSPHHGNWSVEAYVRNVENKFTYAFAEENYIANTYRYAFNPPRTFGMMAAFHW